MGVAKRGKSSVGRASHGKRSSSWKNHKQSTAYVQKKKKPKDFARMNEAVQKERATASQRVTRSTHSRKRDTATQAEEPRRDEKGAQCILKVEVGVGIWKKFPTPTEKPPALTPLVSSFYVPESGDEEPTVPYLLAWIYILIGFLLFERLLGLFDCKEPSTGTNTNLQDGTTEKPLETPPPTKYPPTNNPRDCGDVTKDGLHKLPSGQLRLCANTGWTVFQHRFDGSVPFENRDWNNMRDGFGKTDGEFMMGLHLVSLLIAKRNCQLRIEYTGQDGKKGFSQYSKLEMYDETTRFAIHLGSHNGTLEDGFQKGGLDDNGLRFSTKDKNSGESSNCSDTESGPWWYKSGAACHQWALFGKYGTPNSVWPPDTSGLTSSKMMFICA